MNPEHDNVSDSPMRDQEVEVSPSHSSISVVSRYGDREVPDSEEEDEPLSDPVEAHTGAGLEDQFTRHSVHGNNTNTDQAVQSTKTPSTTTGDTISVKETLDIPTSTAGRQLTPDMGLVSEQQTSESDSFPVPTNQALVGGTNNSGANRGILQIFTSDSDADDEMDIDQATDAFPEYTNEDDYNYYDDDDDIDEEQSYLAAQGWQPVNHKATGPGSKYATPQGWYPVDNSNVDPDTLYEDIGLDRKYFDPEYYTKYKNTGKASYTKSASSTFAKPKQLTLIDVGFASTGSADLRTRADIADPAKEKMHINGLHEDEKAWLELYFEKIKAILEHGIEIEIGTNKMITNEFNKFFMGKVLKDWRGHDLPPRRERMYGTMNNHFTRTKSSRLYKLRKEVEEMLEGNGNGQLYSPIITEDELRQYRSDNTNFVLDNPKDPAKNAALDLDSEDVIRIKKLKQAERKKRKTERIKIASPQDRFSDKGQASEAQASESDTST